MFRRIIHECDNPPLDHLPCDFARCRCLDLADERDAKEHLSDQYEEAFLGILDQLKSDLKVKEIHYIIDRLSDSGLGKKDWDKIREVQRKLGEAGPRSAWINTDDLNDDIVGKPNDLHYSEKGYRILAERFASKAIELLTNADLGEKQP